MEQKTIEEVLILLDEAKSQLAKQAAQVIRDFICQTESMSEEIINLKSELEAWNS